MVFVMMAEELAASMKRDMKSQPCFYKTKGYGGSERMSPLQQ